MFGEGGDGGAKVLALDDEQALVYPGQSAGENNDDGADQNRPVEAENGKAACRQEQDRRQGAYQIVADDDWPADHRDAILDKKRKEGPGKQQEVSPSEARPAGGGGRRGLH